MVRKLTALICALPMLCMAQTTDYDCSISKIHSLKAGVQEAVPGQELFDSKFVKLDLKLSNKDNSIDGLMFLQANALSSLTQCVLEIHNNLTIDSVFFDGVKRVPVRSSGLIAVPAPSTVSAGSDFTVEIYYHGNPPNGGFFNGFSNGTSPTWGNRITWSLSQPNNAMHWWPAKQVLEDKLDSCAVWITVDSSLKAGSNGILENISNFGNKRRFEWRHAHPIAYYLISVAVGAYVDYSFNVTIPGIVKPVLVQNYIYDNPGTLTNFRSEIDKTGDMLKVFSGLFGPYPFANMKYGHCMAPFSGGMEHSTMSTQGVFNTTLTAHELGHQWWGDNVTCKSWRDIWVNEGFARYCEYLYLESVNANQARLKIDDMHKSVLSEKGGSVYVSDTVNASVIFSGRLTYDKGGSLVHMIRFELNDDVMFFKILKAFQSKYASGNAGVAEFKSLLELMSGKDFTSFFNQWYYGEGYPTFNVRYNNDSGYCVLKINQYASKPGVTPLYKTHIELMLDGKTKDTLVRVYLGADSAVFQIPFSDEVVDVVVDPNQWILNENGLVVYDTNIAYKFNYLKDLYVVNIHLSPVPVKDLLHVSGLELHTDFWIYNLSGICVKNGTLNAQSDIDVSELRSGVYILSAAQSNQKFIKE